MNKKQLKSKKIYKQIENIVNWICIIIHPSLLLIIIVVLFIIDSDSFSLLHLTTTYWPIILIWLLFAFLSTKLEEINKQPVKKYKVSQIKNNSISNTSYALLSRKEFHEIHKSLKSYNLKVNNGVYKGEKLKDFIDISYDTLNTILTLQATYDWMSDWDIVKKYIKVFGENYSNVKQKDSVFLYKLETIGFLNFDFGQLNSTMLLDLSKYMHGEISEKKLDDKFIIFKIK